MKLHTFMTTPDLVGREFLGPTWRAWRAIARLVDGDAHLLDEEDQALALRLTGRTTLPTSAPAEMAVGAGRRSGKSRFCGVAAAWFAATDYRDRLAPGETAVIALAAPDRKQAGLLLDYTRAILMGSDLLRAEIVRETADGIELAHGTLIEVVTSSYRSIRGRTIAASILDEVSFLRSEDSAIPDIELYRALLPSMMTLRGKLIAISSPHMRRGLMYELHGRYFGKDEARGLYVQSDSLTLNPSLDSDAVDRAIVADPEAGRSEWGGEFRGDLSQWLSDELIDASLEPHVRGRRGPSVGFVDVSGGRHDATVLAIAHAELLDNEPPLIVLDHLHAVPAPHEPSAVVEQFARELRDFGLHLVTGDRYAGGWVSDSFEKAGIRYVSSDLDKSSIYNEVLPLFSERRVQLIEDKRLLTELRLLERRPRAGGRGDAIDHGRNGHDDSANACAGALWLAARDEQPTFFDMAAILIDDDET
jgi:hypothetical protein